MPKRTDISSILIIGARPIIIGQACEFDYSGTQAVKALKEEGYRIILVNSNPATIMTDPDMAHATYVEPITPEVVAKIIEVERPDALLPTLGGGTALNLAMELSHHGVLEKHGVEMIAANADVIDKAESRIEWWILWRRAAGGLDEEKQQEVYAHLAARLLKGRGETPTAHEAAEMWRAAAALELLPAQSRDTFLAHRRQRPAHGLAGEAQRVGDVRQHQRKGHRIFTQ